MDNGQCVRLTVTGADAEGEEISLVTRGLLQVGDGWWVLRYEETSPDDMATTLTVVQVEGERVTVTRSSAMLSTIVFDRRDTFVGDYPTPLGSLRIRVLTSTLDIRRRGAVGRIRIVYEVTLSSSITVAEELDRRTLDIRFVPCRS